MHYMGLLQQWHSCVKKRAVRSIVHTQAAVQRQNICNPHIYYSICSKANRKDEKEEAVPCDDEELFTSSSGSDSISCGIPRCIAGEERDDTMESREVIVSGEVEIKFRGWKWSSKNNKRHQKKSEINKNINSKINKSKSKIITVSCDQSTPQQTNEKRAFFLYNSYIPTVSQAIEQSTLCMCGCMCTLWGRKTGTGFNTNKRHKQQAVISGLNELQWLLLMSGQHSFLSLSFIYM